MRTYQILMTFSDPGFDNLLWIEFQKLIEVKSIISAIKKRLWFAFTHILCGAHHVLPKAHRCLYLTQALGTFCNLCGTIVPLSKITIRKQFFTI